MAEVFEATALGADGFERRVAIKLVRGERGDPQGRRLFLREARIAARLHHVGIVQVFDYGTFADGEPFLVMELVEGVDAARCLARLGPFPRALALFVVAEAARALHYAHGLEEGGEPLGIVHRDVSPSNLLLAWTGDVKLMDFGVATWARREEETQEGVIRGKVSYMAPEQFTGQGLGPASDVHALGATLHALLTGAPPLRGAEAMVQRLMGAPLELDEGLDPDIAALIAECMRTDPARRLACDALATRALALATEGVDPVRPAHLAEHLAPLRERAPAPAGAEDGRVLSAAAGADDFDVEGEVDRDATTATARRLPAAPPETMRLAGTSRALAPWIGLGGIALLAVLGLGAWGLGRRTGAADAAPKHSAAPAPSAAVREASEPAPAPPASPPAPDPVDAGPARAEPPEPPEPSPARSEPVARPVTGRRGAAPAAPVAAPAARGWVRIGARSADELGAEVIVDGRARGFVPTQLELPVGAHDVEVRGADGQVLRRARVEVGAAHTRARALVVR
jgi:hypothetical protein